jgi:hypothetical protein
MVLVQLVEDAGPIIGMIDQLCVAAQVSGETVILLATAFAK